MTRPGLVLFGALLWFAWHVGTLSAPQTNGYHEYHRHGSQVDPASPQLNWGLQRFAVESENFLGHSARMLETDSGHLAREFHASGQPAEQANWAQQDTGANIQHGLAMAWRQVEPLLLSVQPLAQAGWETVQAGWAQFVQSHSESDRLEASSNPEESDSSSGRSHFRTPPER